MANYTYCVHVRVHVRVHIVYVRVGGGKVYCKVYFSTVK